MSIHATAHFPAHPLPLEVCSACGQSIDPRQTPNVWREEIVCAACREQLENQLIARAFGKAFIGKPGSTRLQS